MGVSSESFLKGEDVYIDLPYEDVMFHWEEKTGKIFRKFYGESEEESSQCSEMFADARSAGTAITPQQYERGKKRERANG